MTPAAADILTRITTAAIRLGLGYLLAGRTRDAEQLAVQLEALGPARRADVSRVEAERIAELRGMLPPVDRARSRAEAGDDPWPTGGPLDEGD